jgi:hypothetical protein
VKKMKDNKTAHSAFRLLVLAMVLHATLASVRAAASDLSVAEDSSLPLSAYVDRGVPDPGRAWTASEYEKALRVVQDLPRSQLPRADGPSQPLFDRLLLSYRREFHLLDEGGPSMVSAEKLPPRDLQELYSPRNQDGLLFDKELVAIRAETLARALETLPTRADTMAQVAGFEDLLAGTSSEAERLRLMDEIRRAEEGAQRVSQLVRSQTSDLLVVASIPQVGDAARQLLLLRAEGLVPKTSQFLADQDLQWVATLLKGSADSRTNASIRAGLRDLAEQLEAATNNP